jgi:hypothetical protein
MDPRRACSHPRNDARLFYFAAALPTVGFVHGVADLNPFEDAALENDTEVTGGCREPMWSVVRRRAMPFLHRHAFWLG